MGSYSIRDAYDSEASHEYARNECEVRTLIPALIGRPTAKPPSGYWRRQMAARLHTTRYGQRWQSETVNSMLKRLLGAALRARTYWSQCREIVLRALTLNLMIVALIELFYRASWKSKAIAADMVHDNGNRSASSATASESGQSRFDELQLKRELPTLFHE